MRRRVKGFSLIEVLLALMVVSIVGYTTLTVIHELTLSTHRLVEITQAEMLAEELAKEIALRLRKYARGEHSFSLSTAELPFANTTPMQNAWQATIIRESTPKAKIDTLIIKVYYQKKLRSELRSFIHCAGKCKDA